MAGPRAITDPWQGLRRLASGAVFSIVEPYEAARDGGAVLFWQRHAQGNIRLVAGQAEIARFGHELDAQGRMLRQEGADRRKHDAIDQDRYAGDPDEAGYRSLRARPDAVGERFDPGRTRNRFEAEFGRSPSPIFTSKQGCSEVLLKRLDAPRYRGLVDGKAAGRRGERAGASEREHITEAISVHACILAGTFGKGSAFFKRPPRQCSVAQSLQEATVRYAVLFTDNPAHANARIRLMPEHLAFLVERADEVLAAGPLVQLDGSAAGGLWLVEAATHEQVRRLVEADLFWPTGLRAQVTIAEWREVFADGQVLI